MRLVILESPFAGEIEANIAYARRCLLHSLRLGEAPIASHLLYTQVLDDTRYSHRVVGIEAGHAWMRVADACVVYVDQGVSKGMLEGIARATKEGLRIEIRSFDMETKNSDSVEAAMKHLGMTPSDPSQN